MFLDMHFENPFARKPRAASKRLVTKPWRPFYKRGLPTKIINATGNTIVLRAKYRDIWEGDRLELEKEAERVVDWTPELYKRLGAFVETDGGGQASGLALYISNNTIGENEEIEITSLSSKDGLRLLKKRARKQSMPSLS